MSLKDLKKEIKEWHCDTFKNITELEQFNKIIEEWEELQEEIADVFISIIAGKERFKDSLAIEWFYQEFLNNFNIDKKIIKKKLEINKKRKWIKLNGTYKHIE